MKNPVPQKPADEPKKGFENHELEHMASTLMDAEEIKSDHHKMKAVSKHLKKKKKMITSIEGLRAHRKELQNAKDQESPVEDAAENSEE